MISRLIRTVQRMIRRVVVVEVHDGGVSVTVGAAGRVDRPQPYGFASHPPTGITGIVGTVDGCQDVRVMLAEDARAYRPTGLASADVLLYDQSGQILRLDSGSHIGVESADTRIGDPGSAHDYRHPVLWEDDGAGGSGLQAVLIDIGTKLAGLGATLSGDSITAIANGTPAAQEVQAK